jgi:hypothetical protein
VHADPSHRVVILTYSASFAAQIKKAIYQIDQGWEFFEVDAESDARLTMDTFPGSLMFTDHAPQGTLVTDFDPGLVLFIRPNSAEPYDCHGPWTVIDESDLDIESGDLRQLIVNFWMHGFIDSPPAGLHH